MTPPGLEQITCLSHRARGARRSRNRCSNAPAPQTTKRKSKQGAARLPVCYAKSESRRKLPQRICANRSESQLRWLIFRVADYAASRDGASRGANSWHAYGAAAHDENSLPLSRYRACLALGLPFPAKQGPMPSPRVIRSSKSFSLIVSPTRIPLLDRAYTNAEKCLERVGVRLCGKVDNQS
jgi:hypothetical protein